MLEPLFELARTRGDTGRPALTMVYHKGLNVSLRNGANGELMTDYDCEQGQKNTVSIAAIIGATICPEITIDSNFDWFDADGLYVAIRYGATLHEMTLWVPTRIKAEKYKIAGSGHYKCLQKTSGIIPRRSGFAMCINSVKHRQVHSVAV